MTIRTIGDILRNAEARAASPAQQKRKKPSLETQLAATLLALGDVPYEDAKKMTAKQIISLYQFDHGILHGIDPINEFWNYTPRLIAPHRRKSAIDTGKVAKTKRIEKRWRDFTAAMAEGRKPPKRERKHRWGSRPFQKRASA